MYRNVTEIMKINKDNSIEHFGQVPVASLWSKKIWDKMCEKYLGCDRTTQPLDRILNLDKEFDLPIEDIVLLEITCDNYAVLREDIPKLIEVYKNCGFIDETNMREHIKYLKQVYKEDCKGVCFHQDTTFNWGWKYGPGWEAKYKKFNDTKHKFVAFSKE